MFDSSLSLSFDYFEKSTDDLLFNPTLSLYLGTPVYPTANIGSTETTGFDVSLGYSKDFNDKVSFNTSVSFTTSDNLVTAINNVDKYIWGAGYGIPFKNLVQFREGDSPGIFWGYKTDGIFQNYDEIAAHATQDNAQPGDIRFVDVDGNGKIDAEDRTKIGDPFADYTIGWNLNLNVHNFDLSVFTYGSFGNDVYRAYERNLIILTDLLEHWIDGQVKVLALLNQELLLLMETTTQELLIDMLKTEASLKLRMFNLDIILI